MYNNKCIKAQIILYSANFGGNKISNENERYTCFSVLLLDSSSTYIFFNINNKLNFVNQ